jgi:hypothetical protein
MKVPSGKFVTIEGERFYEIMHFDEMQPFFISLASDSDLWLYISSNGGLTAGRRNPDNALFPYYTDDKIADSAAITGSKTILQIVKKDSKMLWEPFSDRMEGIYNIERRIAKAVTGNKLLFTEINHDLGLSFSYSWTSSDQFGFIRKSTITNISSESIELMMIDGMQNVLPAGIDRATQNEYSTLVDGYKKTELMDGSTLALFRMEAVLVDRAEPSESLRVNTVWSTGGAFEKILLSSAQLKNFRRGEELVAEHESKGVRGAYFVHSKFTLSAGAQAVRYFVAELNQDADDVASLHHFLKNEPHPADKLESSIAQATEALRAMVGKADGIQQTADENNTARHFSNVLFNIMRGGIYSDGYLIATTDFRKHVRHFSPETEKKHQLFFGKLPRNVNYAELNDLVALAQDAQLKRLFDEYLPLTFSRRHGDPSRPWNNFNIRIKDDEGNKLLSYQGNWRDIFQNWEALSLSYPGYINGIIAKFLNATTADGYNPYRITSDGIDWEVIEPENPWSNIGYWGDHQIIYLQRLLELSESHFPETFNQLLTDGRFAFANVPYRIKSYDQIVENPKDTILFDSKLHHQLLEEEQKTGADARLVCNAAGEPQLVSFTEKMLVTLTAKISNLIPGAGIWMNTLRPEWNDANNALVGTGASMVTLYYIRRFVDFMQQKYQQNTTEAFEVSVELRNLFEQMQQVLTDHQVDIQRGFNDNTRRSFADAMGYAAENYRTAVYSRNFVSAVTIRRNELLSFFRLLLEHIDYNIAINKRQDGMFHAYNLVRFTADSVEVRNLNEMLEGQVAVLSSGKLSVEEVLELLDTMRNSALYRDDQQSYMLYPNKRLPLFMEKNTIPADEINRIPLLRAMIEKGDKAIVSKDVEGRYHFNAGFNNAGFLINSLEKLRKQGSYIINDVVVQEIADLYERVFDHQSFTGRSGTFYKYEGLGSIYWHMVSKLLLAVGENIALAVEAGVSSRLTDRLKTHYQLIKQGIGAHKSPQHYGSFPFDPYSHTPLMSGVQQPGMTGQVKEDVISRFMELGVFVSQGEIHFRTDLLSREEFLKGSAKGGLHELSFTYCAVPFIYRNNGSRGTEVNYSDGRTERFKNYVLPGAVSRQIFDRSGKIQSVVVNISSIKVQIV